MTETDLLGEATAVSKAENSMQPLKQFETVKQSSYKELMESGDIYSIFGQTEADFVPESDDEDQN